jgi:hypothetical protein
MSEVPEGCRSYSVFMREGGRVPASERERDMIWAGSDGGIGFPDIYWVIVMTYLDWYCDSGRITAVQT